MTEAPKVTCGQMSRGISAKTIENTHFRSLIWILRFEEGEKLQEYDTINFSQTSEM